MSVTLLDGGAISGVILTVCTSLLTVQLLVKINTNPIRINRVNRILMLFFISINIDLIISNHKINIRFDLLYEIFEKLRNSKYCKRESHLLHNTYD